MSKLWWIKYDVVFWQNFALEYSDWEIPSAEMQFKYQASGGEDGEKTIWQQKIFDLLHVLASCYKNNLCVYASLWHYCEHVSCSEMPHMSYTIILIIELLQLSHYDSHTSCYEDIQCCFEVNWESLFEKG